MLQCEPRPRRSYRVSESGVQCIGRGFQLLEIYRLARLTPELAYLGLCLEMVQPREFDLFSQHGIR